VSSDETLGRVEELFSRTEELRAKLEQTDDPDVANDILERLTELLKEVEAEIRKARQQAETGAGD
jgi:DNA polymerase II large subunit